MRFTRRIAGVVLALILVGVGLALAGCGSSSNTKTLKLGYVTGPTHPYGLALTQFASQVDQASGGKLKIDLLPVYAGGNDINLLNDIKGGVVSMGSVSAAVWSTEGVTSFQALQMPFLVSNYKLEGAVLASSIQQQMLAGTQALGLHGLAIHEGGLRKPVSAGACLTNLAAFNGVKIRSVQSSLLTDSLAALGASPQALPLSEVYLALKNGTVNALEANLGLVYTNKYYEVAKCITGNVNFWPFPTVLSINNKTWNGLTAQEQGWITSAANKLPAESLAIVANPASPLVANICATGMKFATATPEALAALKAAEAPVYTKYTADPTTGRFVSQIQAIKASLAPPAAPKPYPAGCTAK